MSKQRIERLLLIDIGNTHTHVGLATVRRIIKTRDFETTQVLAGCVKSSLAQFTDGRDVTAACLCSVVPRAVQPMQRTLRDLFGVTALQLTPKTVRGVGIRYRRPDSIGQDRLANAVAVRAAFGAPAVVVDFGTAVTFDVVDTNGDYVGGIIAPGLAAMTDYLHEKTALLPKIRIREPGRLIGRNTEEAMLIGAVQGYRGLVRELIGGLKRELGVRKLPVVATGGYARLIARGLPEIDAVRPFLTLEGLRLTWLAHRDSTA